jgi:hypothetical protein
MHNYLNAGMELSVVAKLRAALIAVLYFCASLQADPVRISFLNDEGALQNTLEFLKSSGCKSSAVGAFRKAVERYNSTGLKFDLSKYPPAQHGFYSFQSSTQLLAVIPRRLWDTPHAYEFNCFDTLILLSDGQLRTGLHPDDHPGEFLAGVTTNDYTSYAHATTAREAFNLSYPAWYQDASGVYIPASMADARICLTADFYCVHMVSASTTEQDAGNQVMNILHASWKNQVIEFPSKFQIILCHQVNLANHLFITSHGGVLFADGNGYVYIEKDGGSGPFVRLDFSVRTDLMAWLAWKFNLATMFL